MAKGLEFLGRIRYATYSIYVCISLYSNCFLTIFITRRVSSRINASFAKDLLVPSQRETVPHVIDLDPLHGLLAALFADIQRLDHRLDVLLAGQLQHGQHLRPVADVAPAHLGPVGREVLRHHLRQGLVRQADVVELAVDVEGRHVLLDVELVGHVGGVEDEVEGVGPRLGPVLVLCADELLGTEFQGVVLLVGAVREGVDLGTEGSCP